MASPTMIGPPPPSPPRRASNLRPRDETPVHFQYATLPMWWETPPIPPAVGTWQSLGGALCSPPAPEARYTNINTLIGRPAPSPPRAAVTQRTAGMGPRALSGMLLPQSPTANNPPRWNPSIYYHNTRLRAATSHAPGIEPPPSGVRATDDTVVLYRRYLIPATQNTGHTLGGGGGPRVPPSYLFLPMHWEHLRCVHVTHTISGTKPPPPQTHTNTRIHPCRYACWLDPGAALHARHVTCSPQEAPIQTCKQMHSAPLDVLFASG